MGFVQQSGNGRQVCYSLAMACCVWLIVPGKAQGQDQAQADTFFETKAKTVEVRRSAADLTAAPTSHDGRIHRIVRIEDLPWIESFGDGASAAIALPKVRHLQFVPPNGVLISAPASFDQEFAGPIFQLESKLSGDLEAEPEHFLAVFHPDIDMNAARALVLEAGGIPEERPDVRDQELLVGGNRKVADALAALDETAWLYPASADLIHGHPVAGCIGAITSAGWVGEYVAKVGQGWDGAGLGSANLTYGFQQLTEKLPPDATRAEFERALAEWSSRVQINFTSGASSGASRHLNVLFASGAHGDGYSFDGRGKVLAHTFYPAPPNPEPIAGDVHFDNDEAWKLGADVDFYSVALHELGHALGLGHSDKPGAVMYAYYKRVTSLTAEDVMAIQSLYAARSANTPTPATPTAPTNPTPTGPTPTSPTQPTNPAQPANPANPQNPPASPGAPTADSTPPSLALTSPAGTYLMTTDPSITLSGTANDNLRVAKVTWQLRGSTESIASGTNAWTAASIPLIRGTNYITLRAYDAAGNSSWRAITVTRR